MDVNIPEVEVMAFREIQLGPRFIGLDIFKYVDQECFVAELTFKKVDVYMARKGTVDLTTTMAQKLMDNLWDCGLRPTEGQGTAGAIDAVNKHLQDMRIIAFNKLKITNGS